MRHFVGERRKARRSWPMVEKRRIVAETLVAGASVSVVARRYDVNANQIFKWRRELAAGGRVALPAPACEFVPIGVFADALPRAISRLFGCPKQTWRDATDRNRTVSILVLMNLNMVDGRSRLILGSVGRE